MRMTPISCLVRADPCHSRFVSTASPPELRSPSSFGRLARNGRFLFDFAGCTGYQSWTGAQAPVIPQRETALTLPCPVCRSETRETAYRRGRFCLPCRWLDDTGHACFCLDAKELP